MYNGKNVSLGSIVWKVLKNPLAESITYEEAAELALEFIKLVGAPVVFLDTISDPIEIRSYKALLPLDVLMECVKEISDRLGK